MQHDDEIISKFFNPKTVAVIGASTDVNSPGYVTFKNFVDNIKNDVFRGKVYPVNIKGEELLGYKIYRSILDIPESVDLAVVIIPARFVPDVMEQIGKKGTQAVVIISAGFSEIGNVELEKRVISIAKKYGIRIIGPNGLGVLDSYSGVDTLFLPEKKRTKDNRELVGTPRPKPGYISFLTQSGAFGIAVLDYMAGEGIGLRRFVSYGNKADIDEIDMLEYLSKDEKTRVILIYSETIKRGREFVEIAKKVSVVKPIIILKSGRTEAGARAAASHTAAIAGSDVIYDVAFKQAGVLRAEDMEHMFDMAKALIFQRPLRGKNIAILTDGGGAGVMATDAAEMIGLNIIKLPEETYNKFEELKKEGVLPKFATNVNPVDLTGSASTEMFEIAADVLLRDPHIDGLVVIALHHVPMLDDTITDRFINLMKKYNKPIVACDIGSQEYACYLRDSFDEVGIPAYPTPERAVRAMHALATYGEYLKQRGFLDEYIKRWKPPE